MSENKHLHFHEAVKIVRKNYGENAIMRLSDTPAVRCPAISTGCLSIEKNRNASGGYITK